MVCKSVFSLKTSSGGALHVNSILKINHRLKKYTHISHLHHYWSMSGCWNIPAMNTRTSTSYTVNSMTADHMGIFPDTQNCELRIRRECQERFPSHCGLAIPTCITGSLTSDFLWSWAENFPGIPGTCATHNFTYQERGARGSEVMVEQSR